MFGKKLINYRPKCIRLKLNVFSYTPLATIYGTFFRTTIIAIYLGLLLMMGNISQHAMAY